MSKCTTRLDTNNCKIPFAHRKNNLNLISTCQFYKRNVLRDLCTVKGLQVILVLLLGGFQLEFVNISRVINHMTCYDWSALIGGTFIKKNPLQDLLSSLNAVIKTNESTWIYNRSCDLKPGLYLKFQMKTTWKLKVHNSIYKAALWSSQKHKKSALKDILRN